MSVRAHLVIAVITAGSLLFILRLVGRRRLRAKYAFLWLSVGIVLAVFAFSPQILNLVSRWLGIFYPPTTFFLFAVTFLLLVVVHFSWELSRLEERTRTLAERMALVESESDAESIQTSATDAVNLEDS